MLYACCANIDKIQLLLLVNVSLIELLFPGILIIIFTAPVSNEIVDHILIFGLSFGTPLLGIILIYLACHRFLQIFLNIRYELYWNYKKTCLSVVGIWTITFAFAISMALLNNDLNQFMSMFLKYVVIPVDFLVVGLFLPAYTYIFIKRKKLTLRAGCF